MEGTVIAKNGLAINIVGDSGREMNYDLLPKNMQWGAGENDNAPVPFVLVGRSYAFAFFATGRFYLSHFILP